MDNLFHEGQYCFRKGLGAENAILKVKDHILRNDNKYVLDIFIDIEGAFDGIWWPSAIAKLKNLKAPKNIINVIRRYFSDRVNYHRSKQ